MASLDEMCDSSDDGRAFEIATDGPSPLEQFQIREDRAEASEVLAEVLEANYQRRSWRCASMRDVAGKRRWRSATRAPLAEQWRSRLHRGLAA